MPRELRGTRYLTAGNEALARFIVNDLRFLDFEETMQFYARVVPTIPHMGRALLGCNDRYFLLAGIMRRDDALHPWLFARCREVEANPDGHIDLWARFHYKSTIITFAGVVQEIMCDPEITIAIFSVVKPTAREFLNRIKQEFENNDYLKALYSDVLYSNPKGKSPGEGRPSKWSIERGITVKRRSNTVEATVEAHGLIDGQPTGRHFKMHVYDDVVTQDHISEEEIKKTTARWEMADNLGTHEGTRKWIAGTRYHFADTYAEILDRKSARPRIYPATVDGTATGAPVFLTPERLRQIRNDQRSTFSAQMLLNPVAMSEATFRSEWFRTYDVIPSVMNVYIMCDPSKGKTKRSDRTAIAVIGINPAGNKFLLDGYCHRMKLSERWNFIKQLEAKWRNHTGVQHVKVGYEQYGMQSDLEVFEEYKERDRVEFAIEEINTPSEGKHSKRDRIERLEPDMRETRFFLPAVVYHPDFGGRDQFVNMSYWTVWTAKDQDAYTAKVAAEGTPDKACPYNIGQVIYRPMRDYTRAQQVMLIPGREDAKRIVTAIRRRDESNDVYDVTRTFIAEAQRHPYAAHDDFLDACSRIFELEPTVPVQLEVGATDGILEDRPTEAMYDA